MTILTRKGFTLFAVAVFLFVLGSASMHPTPYGTSHLSYRGRRGEGTSVASFQGNSALVPTVYVTDNISVVSGSSYAMVNENVVLQSMSLSSVSLTSHGNLSIINSTITISNATYSKIRNFNIDAYNGSSLVIRNSTLLFAGSIVLNGTTAIISNSSLNSSLNGVTSGSGNVLTLSSNNSVLDIYNSTISGLYNQSESHEYTDSEYYCYDQGFSQNAKVPTTSAFVTKSGSHINSILINVTYVGNSTENSNYLTVYYGGSVLTTLPLPYTVNETSREANFSLNFTNQLNTMAWFQNSSNFYLTATINFPDAIAISNLTETFRSNDTVALYGNQDYSYEINDTRVLIYNSSLDLNQLNYNFSDGEANFLKHYLSAENSTILFGDSSIVSGSTYHSPFFSLSNSSVFFFRMLRVETFAGGYPTDNVKLNFTTPQWSPGMVSQSQLSEFTTLLNETKSSWVGKSGEHPALYEYTETGSTWNYTGEYYATYGNHTDIVPISPYPILPEQPIFQNMSVQVPFASFQTANYFFVQGKNSSITVNYTGNLDGLGNLSVELAVQSGTTKIISEFIGIHSNITSSNIEIPVHELSTLVPGNYSINIQLQSTEPHAFSDNGALQSSLQVRAATKATYQYDIHEGGLKNGTIWGIAINGTDYFSSTPSIILNLTNPSIQVGVLNITGMNVSVSRFTLNSTAETRNLTFYTVLSEVEFFDRGIAQGSTWQVLINGKYYSSSSSSITLTLPTGSYNYQILDPSGYSIGNSSGIVNLSHSGVIVKVTSTRETSLVSQVKDHVLQPEYYLPLALLTMALIAISGWRLSHKWYPCSKCGSTRKKKRQSCPYCGNPP